MVRVKIVRSVAGTLRHLELAPWGHWIKCLVDPKRTGGEGRDWLNLGSKTITYS